MKQGKRLLLSMKKLLKSNSIDYKDYLYTKNTQKELELVNINTGQIIKIFK